MNEKRKEALLYKALEYISNVESGFGLYDCLHNYVGMTNAEIEEVGYELQEHYEPERPEQLAAASDKRYISLEELERQTRLAVEAIIMDGTQNTSSGSWILYFEELEKQTKLCLDDKPFFQQLIANMLCERCEVADLQIGENCFDLTFYLDYCPNLEGGPEKAVPGPTPEPAAPAATLRELLHTRWEDVHLLHGEVEMEPITVVELDEHTLTDAGKEAWADVLDAKVLGIRQGIYGLQMELSGVKPRRVAEFTAMLAGYCLVPDYEKWVTQEADEPVQTPEMKL